jgi:hypothetical protein
MEIEGHPTHDLIEELERRGAVRLAGTTAGPDAEALRFLSENAGDLTGQWLFVAPRAYETGFDEAPE